jgi:hypothetical protein
MFFSNGDHDNLSFKTPLDMLCFMIIRLAKGFRVEVVCDNTIRKENIEKLVNHMYNLDLVFKVFGKNLTIKQASIYSDDENTVTFEKKDITSMHTVSRKISKRLRPKK